MEYRVYWTATVEGETVVEAENEDEAWQLVEDLSIWVEDPQDEDGVIISQVSARTMLDAYYILDAQMSPHP